MSEIATPKMVVPEFILHQTLTSVLTFIRNDYAASVIAGDTTKSWLYRTLTMAGFQKYDFFTQAIAVFTSPKDDPRYLTVELMFNEKRKGAPSIYVNLPSEQTQPNGNGMGSDEDFYENEYTEGDPDTHTPGSTTPVYTRRYSAIYNIVVTSDNSNEVILLYHMVKAMITTVIPHLHFYGLQNIALGGQDIQPYNELANQLYMRAVSCALQYDTSVPSIYSQFLPNDIIVAGTPIDPGTEDDEEVEG